MVTRADGSGTTDGLGLVRDAAPLARSDGARASERPALLAGLLAAAIGIVVLAGWVAGLEPLKSFLPNDLPMKANAALLLVLSGTALTLQGSGRRARVEDALAIVVLGVAAATALEFATGADLGIDRLLVSDVAQPGAPYPGRMALGAVLGFAAMALALLAMRRSWRGWHPSGFLAILVGLVGGLGILGYLYGARQLTSIGSVTQVAFPAALGFSILAGGLVAADPEHGLMHLLRDPGLGGQLTRRLVPTIVLVLPVAGWLKIGLVQVGILDERVGVAAMVCLDILVLGGVGIWVAGSDVTARKSSEARYRGLLEAAPDAMVVVDQRGKIVLLNVQAERQFGYDRDELVGQPITTIIPEGFAERIIADDLRSIADALAQQIGNGIALVARRKDASEFPVEIMLSPLESADGILITAAIRDISMRREAEEEVRALNAELEGRVERRTAALEAANRELEAFSYSVSHDLRAPLRSIDAFSQILLNEYAVPLDAEGRRILAIVLRNVKQMGILIDDLLAFSRVSRASLDHRPVDMARLARGVAEELGAASLGREIAIDVGPLADVPGDAALLRQVWANLLGNSVKFTGPVEHATVEVRSERSDGECRFTVRDNGVGFDPAYLDRLFAPFSRLHATADFQGTGIGLAIVARIVARHGGRVWAEGSPGEGALFGFSIPEHLEAA